MAVLTREQFKTKWVAGYVVTAADLDDLMDSIIFQGEGVSAETPSSILSKLLSNADTKVLTDSEKGALSTFITTAQADSQIATAFAAFIGAAPSALDTWLELVSLTENNEDALAALTSLVGTKLTASVFTDFQTQYAIDLAAKLDKTLTFTTLSDSSTIAFNMASKEQIAAKVTAAASPRTLAITNKPAYGSGLLKVVKGIAGDLTLTLDAAFTNKNRITGDDIAALTLTGNDGAHFLLSFYIDGSTIYWFYPQSGGGSSVSFASDAEAIAGVNTTKAVTPANLAATFTSKVGSTVEGIRSDLLTILETESGWSNSSKTITGQTDNGQAGQEAYHTSGIYTFRCAGGGVWRRIPTADRVVGKITDSSIITNITNTGNWTAKAYTGPAIATLEGQYYENTDYRFISYTDGAISRLTKA